MGRVLRLRDGEAVRAADGRGGARSCVLRTAGRDVRLEPCGPVCHADAPAPGVAVAFPLLKADRTSWAVQKLTELGVDRMVPLVAARSVVRTGGGPTGDGPKWTDRMERVVRSAAAQSRRLWLPEVSSPTTLSDLAGYEPVVVAHPGGGPLSGADRLVAVGPEGGWDSSELLLAAAKVGLGPTVLRAETAAVAAATLLCGIRSGLVRPATTGGG